MSSTWPHHDTTRAQHWRNKSHRVAQSNSRLSEKQQKADRNLLLYNNKYKNINIIYIYNSTKCYAPWIVACHAGLPIFPLFNLQFCKIRLRFSYVTFSLSFFLSSQAMPFYPAICAICGISLILLAFFLPKRLPKLANNAVKMANHWF